MEQHQPAFASEAWIALEWNRVERTRRMRRQNVARLQEKQRLADTNKWAGRKSRRAKMQVAVKQALRDWFEAARNGAEGVSGAEVADAVITLGLNDDYKQVQRTIFAEVQATNGLLRSVKSFTAALLACCSSDDEKNRLFRALRGEGEWGRFGVGGGRDESPPMAASAAEATFASGVPAFITKLAAYRRKILMATVADKFPTPCTSSFWMPDCKDPRHLETSSCELPDACPACTIQTSESPVEALRPDVTRAGCERDVNTGREGGVGASHGYLDASAVGDGDDAGDDSSGNSSGESVTKKGATAAQTASIKTRQRFDAVMEGIVLPQERDQLHRAISGSEGPTEYTKHDETTTGQRQALLQKTRRQQGSDPPAAADSTRPRAGPIAGRRPPTSSGRQGGRVHGAEAFPSPPTTAVDPARRQAARGSSPREHHQRPGDQEQAALSGEGGDGLARSSSTGGNSMATIRSGHSKRGDLRNTAERVRDSLHKRDLHLAKAEARWDDYQSMKRRWWRRTPIGILKDDELNEADRSYSRLPRPSTSEGTESHHRWIVGSGSASSRPGGRCLAFTCQRPRTTPAGITTQGTRSPLVALVAGSLNTSAGTTCLTFAGNSNANDCDSSVSRGRGVGRALALGPIPLDEGKKLRYPLLQLEREKATAAEKSSVLGGARSAGTTAKRRPGGSSSYVNIPLTRDCKGRWQPRLVRVPCGPLPA